MRFLDDNLIDGASLTASTENASYPVSNIQDPHLASVYRSTATSANIVMNMGMSMDADIVFIANHNFTDSATVTLEANSSDSWGAPPFSESLTVEDLINEAFTSASYQYWRIVIADAGNTDGYLKIGGMGLGEFYQVPGIGTTYQVERISTALKYSTRYSRQVYGSSGVFFRTVNAQIPFISQAERVVLEDFYFSKDFFTPFYVQFSETCIDEPAIYATLEENALGFQTVNTQPIGYSSRVTLTEAR